MSCIPLIDDPFGFPRRAHNRPALPRIGYRIGRYEDFVEVMLRGIDAALPLQAWTHREPDDPPTCAPRPGARASPSWCG